MDNNCIQDQSFNELLSMLSEAIETENARGFNIVGILRELLDRNHVRVSPKAAEAPGGQDASKVIAAARCIKHWHDHIYKNGDEGMVVSGEHVRELWGALAEYDRLAPAAPSERADEILKESPVKFQHNGFEHQVDRMAQYVIDTHPGTSLAAAYRAVCEELANRAQARAGLSSQEGK